jgi:hypothetical protein
VIGGRCQATSSQLHHVSLRELARGLVHTRTSDPAKGLGEETQERDGIHADISVGQSILEHPLDFARCASWLLYAHVVRIREA